MQLAAYDSQGSCIRSVTLCYLMLNYPYCKIVDSWFICEKRKQKLLGYHVNRFKLIYWQITDSDIPFMLALIEQRDIYWKITWLCCEICSLHTNCLLDLDSTLSLSLRSKTIRTCLAAMRKNLGHFLCGSSEEQTIATKRAAFCNLPDIPAIIDCTELFMETPKSEGFGLAMCHLVRIQATQNRWTSSRIIILFSRGTRLARQIETFSLSAQDVTWILFTCDMFLPFCFSFSPVSKPLGQPHVMVRFQSNQRNASLSFPVCLASA